MYRDRYTLLAQCMVSGSSHCYWDLESEYAHSVSLQIGLLASPNNIYSRALHVLIQITPIITQRGLPISQGYILLCKTLTFQLSPNYVPTHLSDHRTCVALIVFKVCSYISNIVKMIPTGCTGTYNRTNFV